MKKKKVNILWIAVATLGVLTAGVVLIYRKTIKELNEMNFTMFVDQV